MADNSSDPLKVFHNPTLSPGRNQSSGRLQLSVTSVPHSMNPVRNHSVRLATIDAMEAKLLRERRGGSPLSSALATSRLAASPVMCSSPPNPTRWAQTFSPGLAKLARGPALGSVCRALSKHAIFNRLDKSAKIQANVFCV